METKELSKLINQYVSDLGRQVPAENQAIAEPALGLLAVFLHTMVTLIDSIDGLNSGHYTKLDEIDGALTEIGSVLRSTHEAEHGSMS